MYKGESLRRKPGSGRKAKKMSPDKVRALERCIKKNLGASQRKTALKFGVSLTNINKAIHCMTGLPYMRRKHVLAATEEQKKKQMRHAVGFDGIK